MAGIFRAFPDYRNNFEEVESKNNFIAISGYSSSSDERLDGPALWTARVQDDKVAEWCVYNDTPENREQLGIRRKE